ncbi:MLP-like protein 43 [Silene latifolia]|uniref:MLP-like protein 43 n=1 Tax=Silene latifolia TaxID=37657 RepID=UPI003D77E693
MGVTGKLEVEVDIKASGDVFHELLGKRPHHVSNMVPDHIHGCDLHEGEFGELGSILKWDYTLDGKKSADKHLVEVIDEENKILRIKLMEGSDLLQVYKSMKISLHVIPKGDIDAILWKIEFERFDDFGPYPTNVMDFIIKVTRDLEAHHVHV